MGQSTRGVAGQYQPPAVYMVNGTSYGARATLAGAQHDSPSGHGSNGHDPDDQTIDHMLRAD
ncbi:hypothetical protein RA276_32570, partial [Pseudomonas syringae pv. tagetis]|uniref:hypothetical protein n=1 Tax=Pseudomonas syringae group genomosp. 7 TaxID=251699 RepID=UPI00376FDEF2